VLYLESAELLARKNPEASWSTRRYEAITPVVGFEPTFPPTVPARVRRRSNWSEWQDLNLRSLRPERSAIPGFATLRRILPEISRLELATLARLELATSR
jgi:hypothetical protein